MARWQFKVVLSGLEGFFARRRNGTDFLDGTAQEALAFAGRVRRFYEDRGARRVDACAAVLELHDLGDMSFAHRVFSVRPHPNGRDWWVDPNCFTHPLWVHKQEEAISYVVFRGRGHICEIQIFDHAGSLSSIVLADTRGDDPFLALDRSSRSEHGQLLAAEK